MQPVRPYHLSLTLARFRFGVSACCWTIGLCLLVQILVWTGAVFTQARFEPVEEKVESTRETAPTVVTASARQQPAPRVGTLAARGRDDVPEAAASSPDAAEVDTGDEDEPPKRGYVDDLMHVGAASTAVVGPIAMLLIIPMMALGMIVAVVGQVPGTERAASALLWGSFLSVVILPVGRAMGVAEYGGLFLDYASILDPLDATMGDDGFPHPGAVAYARHLLLPLAGIIAMTLIGLLYRAGIEAGLIPARS